MEFIPIMRKTFFDGLNLARKLEQLVGDFEELRAAILSARDFVPKHIAAREVFAYLQGELIEIDL